MEIDETRPITDEVFIAAMRAVVAERGEDYLYPEEWKDGTNCRYVTPDGSACACLIGAALGHIGVPLATLAGHEGTGAGYVLGTLLPWSQVSDALADAANHAQDTQDKGETWGAALAAFFETFNAERRKS